MNTIKSIACLLIALALDATATDQSIVLQPGWNAIWLEVEPTNANGRPAAPTVAFDTTANTSISIIASPKPLAGIAETFGSNPTSESGTFNQESWEFWKRNDPSGSSNLVMTTGNRGYLINNDAAAAISITVSGEVSFFRPDWIPDRYNLIGFGIDSSAPSFDTFFAPAAGRHPVARIYTLNTAGNWVTVTGSNPIEDGAAYWIFCNGISDYMGPVAVDLPNRLIGQLNFGAPTDAVKVGTGVDEISLDLAELTFTNLAASGSATPEIDLIDKDSGAGSLRLHVVTPAPSSLRYDRGNEIDSSPNAGATSPIGESVAAGASAVLSIGAQREWSTGTVSRTNIYRLSTGAGTSVWLPVSATTTNFSPPADLIPESPAANAAGLWVGEINVDGVTSIVELGSPVRPTSGSAPLRIVLHSDASGAVSLLSQVTIMQTKTADDSVEPQPVLVVDPAQIPFYEGVRERGGKKVGIRIESAAFDMPRLTDTTTQANLLAAIVVESNNTASKWEDGKGLYPGEASVTQTAIQSYLDFRNLRPPTLTEAYHLTWPLEGTIGAGKTARTAGVSPLTLDPYHRSNPFRHAFHQKHARGTSVTRTVEIVFASDTVSADQLRGTYRETIEGLTKEALVLTGNVRLERISNVVTLGSQ